MKDPVIVKSAATVHDTVAEIMAGTEAEKVHPPAVAKFFPATDTVPPTALGLGVIEVIRATTLKVFVAESRRFPVTVSVAPVCSGVPAVPTLNEPVTTPPLIEQVGLVTMFVPPVIVQVVSVPANPLPETVIVSPPLPLLGENVTRGRVTVKAAVTVVCTAFAPFWNCTVYEPTGAGVVSTVKAPARTPFTSMLQAAGFAAGPKNKTPAGIEVTSPVQPPATPT
jgi:hypothetical protein